MGIPVYRALPAQKEGIMAKDPICGMEVDEAKAAGSSTYKGKTYYFCASHCKTAFDANPEQYAEKG
jgi:YHS domain-containing protein